MILSFSSVVVNFTKNSEAFSSVFFLEMTINKCFKYVQVLGILFFWRHYLLAIEKMFISLF